MAPRQTLLKTLAIRERGQKFFWAITLKGSDELRGRIDPWPFDGKNRDIRGFWLDPELHGRGLMTDLLAAWRATAKPVASTVLKNNPARRLYERAGFSVVGSAGVKYEMRLNTDFSFWHCCIHRSVRSRPDRLPYSVRSQRRLFQRGFATKLCYSYRIMG